MKTKTRSIGSEDRLDTVLRSSLEPDPATVETLIRGALAASETPPAPVLTWRLATAALVVILAASPLFFFHPTDTSEVTLTPPDTYATAESKPTTLLISNESGLVTVTTPAGTKMVMLNSVSTGDIS